MLNNFSLEEVYISDINRELIESYIQIRDNVNELIITLDKLESEYLRFLLAKEKITIILKEMSLMPLKQRIL